MIKKKLLTVEHLEGSVYKVTISKTVDQIANAVLALSRIDDDFAICKADFCKDSGNHIIIVRALGDQQDKCAEDVERFLADFIEQALRKEPAMVSNKDHELIEGVSDELTKFFEEDEENRAVVCLIMDKNTERIKGIILGERNNLLSSIRHALSKDNQMLADISDLCLQMISSQIANIVMKAKNDNNQ